MQDFSTWLLTYFLFLRKPESVSSQMLISDTDTDADIEYRSDTVLVYLEINGLNQNLMSRWYYMT